MFEKTPSRITVTTLLASLAWAQPCLAQLDVPGDYATIQEAVDAATSGTTISIAAGQYAEQVLIAEKDLTLLGAPGATLIAPAVLDEVDLGGPGAAPRRPLLAATRCEVDIDGMTFDGLRRGGEFFRFTGVLYVGAGGTVSNCTFTGFRPEPLAFTGSPERAIQVVNPIPTGSGKVDVGVITCSFSDNVDSIFIFGDGAADPNALRVHCNVSGNTISGLGPQPFTPQTGIFVATGTDGIIQGNDVSQHAFLGSGAFSIAIQTGALGYGPDFVMPRLQIVGNTTTSNTVGILSLFADRNQIVNNTVTSGPFGFSGIALSGQGTKIVNNWIGMDQSVVQGNSGVALLGAEFDSLLGSGFAMDTNIVRNTISGAALPVWSQTGAAGTSMHGNVILP